MREAKGKSVIEFCKDKCWNGRSSPCVCLNERNNAREGGEGAVGRGKRREARSRVSNICIIFAVVSQCAKSLPASQPAIQTKRRIYLAEDSTRWLSTRGSAA